jgi:hypothetical protein
MMTEQEKVDFISQQMRSLDAETLTHIKDLTGALVNLPSPIPSDTMPLTPPVPHTDKETAPMSNPPSPVYNKKNQAKNAR